MKINLKKVASVLASAVMFGSTLGFAAAAWADPFVKNGVGDAAIVVGAGAATTDLVAATDLGTSLNAKVTVTGETTVSGGDSVKLERGSNKFNYGDALNAAYTSLDHEELSTVLADGTYLNDDNTEYDYEQKVTLSAETISFFQDSKFNDKTPVIGFNMDKGDLILNYTLTFTPDEADGGAAVSSDEYPKLDNTDITMLGKEFFISDVEYTTNGIQMTLLDSANKATVSEGESTTVMVGDKSYVVSIDFVEDSNTAKLTINGVTTNSIDEGQTYKLTDGTYVGIKDVSYSAKDSGISKVEFTLGIGKIVLENTQEVKLNDEAISVLKDANGYKSEIKAYFTNSTATDISTIVLQWKLDSDAWVAPGYELLMPGFNAIKLSMTSWVAPGAEETTLDDGGDYVRLVTPIEDGTLDMGILYTNSSKTGFAGLGEDATTKLVTNATASPSFALNVSEDSYIVLTWISGDEAESYAYGITSVTDTDNDGVKNATILTNLLDSTDTLNLDYAGDTDTAGNDMTVTLVKSNADDETASIKVTGTTAYGALIATKEGLVMTLPVIDNLVTQTADTYINASAQPTTWAMNFSEEDKDGNLYTGSATDEGFLVTVDGSDADGTQATGTSLTEIDEEDDSDYEIAYFASDIATKVRLYNPSGTSSLDSVQIFYPGAESYAEVYVAETSATSGAAGSIKVIKDSEIDSAKDKNLIVVGGSCINTVAATVLGKSAPVCGEDFTALTGVAAGKYLIEVVASPYATADKIAMLVAGYDAAETTLAVAKVKEGEVSTAVGTKLILPQAAA